MANRYMTGFDDHDLATAVYEWQFSNNGGSPLSSVASITAGRVGNCLRLSGSSAVRTRAIVTCTPDGQATVTVGFAIRFDAVDVAGSEAFALLGDTTMQHVGLRLLNGGNIGVYRMGSSSGNDFDLTSATLLATSTTVAVANTWLVIEWAATIHDSAGVVKLRFQGASTDELSLTGQDTRNGGTALITRLGFNQASRQGSNTPIVTDIDDVWVNDTTGSDCTGFLGDMRVDFHLPVADGANTDWSPSTGTDHYAVIDENPPNTSDYLTAASTSLTDTFTVEDFKNDGATIYAIQIGAVTQKTDAGPCALQTVVREGGSDSVSGADLYPSTTWATLHQNYSLASGDAKRAAAGFNAAEYGVSRTT